MLLKESKAEMDLLQRTLLILPLLYSNCFYRTEERQKVNENVNKASCRDQPVLHVVIHLLAYTFENKK